jgi:hypothetical protein
MKIQEAIDKLIEIQKKHPNAIIARYSNNREISAFVKSTGVTIYPKGKKEEKHCIDDFDGTHYKTEILRISGGDLPLVIF